ncbi:MAG: hypothetical protein IPK35_14395 [Saprospiraceae bacterium]|jgi:hypothetical protein|nr:hypothetical protein [Saprospiraceae bacterium]
MRLTNFPRFVFFWIAMSIGYNIYSQESKEAVILYNTKPVLAEITKGGSVLQIVRDEPDFLKGFTLEVPDYVKHMEELKKTKGDNAVSIVESNAQLLTVSFDRGFAVLTEDAINQLDNAIRLMKGNPKGKLILRTLSISDPTSLDQNRINSIKSYFNIRGLNPDVIRYEAMKGSTNLDEVKITLSLN